MRVGTRIGAVFFISVLVAGTLALVAWRGAALSAVTNKSVNRTNEVLKKLDLVFEDFVDIETGSRGYALTGQQSYLEPYVIGSTRALGDLADLRQLVADDSGQVERVARLDDLARQQIYVAKMTVEMRYVAGMFGASALVATAEGKEVMDSTRAVVVSMQQDENRLLAQRLALAERRARQALLFIIVSMAALVLLMLLGVLWLTRSITRPMAMLAQAARQFGEGGQPAALAVRQDEIGDFAREFMEMSRQRQQVEDRLHALIELAPEAFFQTDLDARFTNVNVAACQLLGYTRDELLNMSIFDVITEEDAGRLKAVRDKLLVPGQVERGEWIHRRKNGSFVLVEVSANILADGRWQAFGRDITERKKTEEALRRAVTAREHVLGIVAHDLRNPLTSIVQSVTLAQHATPPERLDKPLAIIARAATRMDHLIQGLLDVSLIEAGQLKITRDRLYVSNLVLDAVDMQRPLASSAGLVLRVDLAHNGNVLWANRDRLHEVLENLIGNAIKFTKPGGHITVGATQQDGAVLFTVADTGCGIPPQSLTHVFDPFWQAVPRRGRLGAGLGLAITKGIVEAHGGRIWVESKVGRGSAFFFTIPKAPPESDSDHPEQTVHELKA
jgi:PAS domain S-box-containing protein